MLSNTTKDGKYHILSISQRKEAQSKQRYELISALQQNTVAYNEGQPRDLEEAVVLRDAISDLPAVMTLCFLLIGFLL